MMDDLKSGLIEAAQARGLPSELLEIILNGQGSEFLDTVAQASLNFDSADNLLPYFVDIAADTSQRWIQQTDLTRLSSCVKLVSCFARVLPFLPYLRPLIRDFLTKCPVFHQIAPLQSITTKPDSQITTISLTALFRLLSHDLDAFREYVKPVDLCSLFSHDQPQIRYLAIQCFCKVMQFADALNQDLVTKHIEDRIILGDWEGQQIDYRLFLLHEERRWTRLDSTLNGYDTTKTVSRLAPDLKLAAGAVSIAGVILPRPRDSAVPNSSYVHFPTSSRNLNAAAKTLLKNRPALLVGAAGSGKTAIVRELAHHTGALSNLITLHLNDQTDAKSLLGIYTSSVSGAGFTWQPGVLTKAVAEGRWLLIEDIDRAPAEVIGVLRPLIENNELSLPSRKEIIKAGDGFRIFGTIRSSSRIVSGGVKNSFLSNPRMWCTVEVAQYSREETETLLSQRFPSISALLAGVLAAHYQLVAIYAKDPQFKASQGRLPSIKDLVKWCRRLRHRYESSPASSQGLLPETFMIDAFKDGLDCYAAHLSERSLFDMLAYAIAEGLSIAPNVAKHTLQQQSPIVQEQKSQLQVGRSALTRSSTNRSRTQASRFALTRQVRQNMEAIVSAVSMREPLLLVGETGVGKTTILQHIASRVGHDLTVVNLSNQSEASDLLGGLKPVTTKSLVIPLVDEFNDLFDRTFSANKNADFRNSITKAFQKQRWSRLIGHWERAIQLATKSLCSISKSAQADGEVAEREQSAKRRKIHDPKYQVLQQQWSNFAHSLSQVKMQVHKGDQNQIFAFVESRLVKAVRTGGWLLLDEINLASSETLDNIVSLLHLDDGDSPHLLLAEAGNVERIDAHPNFRVFAAMNPATDTGKKDLPIALRTLFTEMYVMAGDTEVSDLVEVITSYLDSALNHDKKAANDLAVAYLALKDLNTHHRLTDGAGDLPHFSLRSLTRCLQYVQQHNPSRGLRRAMLDGLQMSFFTVLDAKSQEIALPAIEKPLFGSLQAKKAMQSQKQRAIVDRSRFVLFDEHAVIKGPLESDMQSHYILTKSVRRNLIYLARAASMSRFPILLQGPTSAGKTSMVEYLAKYSGNKFVRINNHEHTDLQEYLGSYTSGSDGKLEFREGVLVEALRQGHWIVLDELNLAPSDVLEALNRLLDDNRELLIPETQEIVRPHPNFMLFATQNPAGLYGGRKRFSRAFRNRFLEIHVDDIPEGELQQILSERTQIAPTFCKLIVEVYKRLSLQRSSSRLFEARNSFATLRDLFRWASRPVDDRSQLAIHGYMLLAERVRETAEKAIVKQTIEETLRVEVDENSIYNSVDVPTGMAVMQNITWTRAMRRLYTLISAAIENNEPVLLVGETGCGKTQVCQCVAAAFGRPLNVYNAHSNTETGDLIGSQRPVRHKSDLAEAIIESMRNLGDQSNEQRKDETVDMTDLITQFKGMDTSNFDPLTVEKVKKDIAAYQSLFVWSDGTLVRAMKEGCHFLLDEISLADDSVLERMNSVLEPSRTILLAEKGAEDNLVIAKPEFQFLATMNPGGDYGKRELSAALRNRLTEIWVPPLSDDADVVPILKARLTNHEPELASSMVKFAKFFQAEIQGSTSTAVPLRLLLNWSEFIMQNDSIDLQDVIVHGAAMTFIDGLGANPASLSANVAQDINQAREACLAYLCVLFGFDAQALYHAVPSFRIDESWIQFGQFGLQRSSGCTLSQDLNFDAFTTLRNASRIVRALQTNRPLLLEGNPGVGKTAIVASLAKLCGRPLTRVNLSDQTDLMDLFGADTPAEGEGLGNFIWRDGPLLKAMQTGGWVLLDEMNLASQSVLEGLNACLDHRKEVYIAELDRTFHCHPDFTLFATQNPHAQGGGRKGLPASFVNRFTVVYADPFTTKDLISICTHKYPSVPLDQVTEMVSVVDQCQQLTLVSHDFNEGGPWELNLRDLDRWLSLCRAQSKLSPSSHFNTVVSHRFRTSKARTRAQEICAAALGASQESLHHNLTRQTLQIGSSFARRDCVKQLSPNYGNIPLPLLDNAKSFLVALNESWPIILSGKSGSGKTTLVRCVAALIGAKIEEFSMTSDVDTADLIGGYEQFTPTTILRNLQIELSTRLINVIGKNALPPSEMRPFLEVYKELQQYLLSSKDLIVLLQQIVNDQNCCEVLQVQDILTKVREVETLQTMQTNQFVWNDGILIEAMLSGSWIILDHANLCNPSVLDRLNSLLEPNGYLVLNEQHGVDGQARIVFPAPGFRIVLTIDPAFGELSRAMRNRSLELSLDDMKLEDVQLPVPSYPDHSAIARLRPVPDQYNSDVFNVGRGQDFEPWLNQLTPGDLRLLAVQPENTVMSVIRQEANFYLEKASLTSNCIVVQQSESDHMNQQNWPNLVSVNEAILPLLVGNKDLAVMKRATRVQLLATLLRRKIEELQAIRSGNSGADHSASYLVKSSPSFLRSKRDKKTSIPAFSVVSDLGAFIWSLITICYDAGVFTIDFDLLQGVATLFSDLIDLFGRCTINLTVLQSYLQIVDDIRVRIRDVHPQIEQSFVEATRKLGQAGRLQNGQSLRLMWPKWKALSTRTEHDLTFRLTLEALIQRFDRLSKTLPQKLVYLAGLRSQLLDVYNGDSSRSDSQQLVQSLNAVVEEWSTQAVSDDASTGYFAGIFDKLLYKARVQGTEIETKRYHTYILLSHFSTSGSSQAPGPSPETPVQILESLTGGLSFTGQDVLIGSTMPGEIGINEVVRHFQNSIDQPMGRLKYVQEEMQQVVSFISGMSKQVCTPNTSSVFKLAQQLFVHFVDCHCEHDASKALISMEDISSMIEGSTLSHANSQLIYAQSDLALICQDLSRLDELVARKSAAHADCGRLLVRLSILCLRSFVPDQKFDPAVYYTLLNERHLKRKTQSTQRIKSWTRFQQHVSGQDTSFVIRAIEEDLTELEEVSEAPEVYRPEDNSSDYLHGEFVNLLRSVVNVDIIDEVLKGDNSRAQLLLDRTNVCIGRLSRVHRAYDDMLKPIAGLLRSLCLGLRMAAYEHYNEQESFQQLQTLDLAITDTYMDSKRLKSIPLTWSYLRQLKLRLWMTGNKQDAKDKYAAHVASVIDRLYVMWKVKLDRDTELAEQQARYYSYRGEDDEEPTETDVRELFPRYEDDEEAAEGDMNNSKPEANDAKSSEADLDVRASAIELSRYHRSFHKVGDLQELLQQSLKDQLLPRDSMHVGFAESHIISSRAMPALILKMDEKLLEYTGKAAARALNVYTDHELTETQKLFDIVSATQKRFREINEAWPDHTVPLDVLRFCEEVRSLKISTPIAKLMTKTEKMLDVVAQWQAVASREWSVSNILDSLTNLIIHWRRLELASWSRLLEDEDEKVQEEVDSWYFIAYESVVYNARRLVQGEASTEESSTVKDFCSNLASTLQDYLRNAALGQFNKRLDLLESMATTLTGCQRTTRYEDWIGGTLVNERLASVVDTVQNVIIHYRRYEEQVIKRLTDARSALEKKITEQIKLASWKDTNITALRESARRSHFKLFKVVKKYRSLLHEPVSNLTAGSTTRTQSTGIDIPVLAPDLAVHLIASDVLYCKANIPHWEGRPQRLREPVVAANTMRYVHTSNIPQFSAASELRAWTEDLKESAKELRKETPSTATEENASLVRDLKQRKRRLLADTLKNIAAYGVRRNIGTDEQQQQSSLAVILSTTPQLYSSATNSPAKFANDQFHALLDVLPLARSSALEHSEDLTDGEVNRSLGFLEGGLSLVIRQRRTLGVAYAQFGELVPLVAALKNILADRQGITQFDHDLTPVTQRMTYLLCWLPSLLRTYANVVSIQSQYVTTDTKPLASSLYNFSDLFKNLADAYNRQNGLPSGLTSFVHDQLMKDCETALDQLNEDLSAWAKREAQIEHVCESLKMWTSKSVSQIPHTNEVTNTKLTQIDETVRECLNAIFVALQNSADSLRTLPTTRDSPGWLTKTSYAYQKVLGAMQCHAIQSRIDRIYSIFRSVSAEDFQSALSLVVASLPIVSQYQDILEDLLRRMLLLHGETCDTLVYLGTTFTTLAKEGFCSPPEAGKNDDKTGKVEQGTGLGEGDAPEDISKDVAEDEDLTELAQEPGERQDQSEDMEKSKDAVDMGADDLEGEMGSGDEQVSGDEDESDESEDQNDLEEETGDVDDLDPAAVDEKLWDEKRDEAEQKDKEMKSEKVQGQKSDDQTAKNEQADANSENGDEMDGNPEEEQLDGEQKAEGEEIDQHLHEEEKLDLPEDIQLNGEEDKEAVEGSEMGDLSDIEDDGKAEDTTPADLPDEEMMVREDGIEPDDKINTDEDDEQEEGGVQDEEMLDQPDEKQEEENHATQEDDQAVDTEDQDGGETGTANNQADFDVNDDENAPQGQNSTETTAQESKAGKNTDSSAQPENGTSTGAMEQGTGQQDQTQDKQETALQKLADVLEKYHQRRDIFTQNDQRQERQAEQDIDMADADFEHLGDGEDDDETQALGTADHDTHQNFDSRQAIEDARADQTENLPMPQEIDEAVEAVVPETLAEKMSRLHDEHESERENGVEAAAVSDTRRLQSQRENQFEDDMALDEYDVEDDLEVDDKAITAPMVLPTSTSIAEAQQLWSLTSSKTQALSLTLTEQLRLILQPTTATKLRGDFRTGKRLNIRRIIPYIASGYKRDKIWMRRSIPSKRNYQVMLAVDDSKSMTESGADILALETLCMLSRSLSMLEVGELSVVAFGKNYLDADDPRPAQAVKIAHSFSTPFSPSISGPEVFRNFTFNQTGTNIRALLHESIALFKDARLKSSAREAVDLWQLQIIISDGHIGSDSDDGVRRLVRNAREEKIVSVFVVVDNGQESIVDLKEATLDKDGEVKMKRYLEGFPFAYYVVVREVHDLPGVLCRVLKGWFEGVVEQG